MKKFILLVFNLLMVSILYGQDARIEFQKISNRNQIGMFRTSNSNLIETQTNVSKQRLDSIYSLNGGVELTSKSVWTYNNQGNVVTGYDYNWDGSSWIPIKKTDFTYDNQNRLSSQTFYQWEVRKPNSWGELAKYGYTYNAIGLRKTWINYGLLLLSDSTFDFFESSRYEYIYNAKNQLVNFSMYSDGSKIENSDRYYDRFGNDSLHVFTGSMDPQKVTFENSYNGDKLTSTLITHGFVRATTGWEPDYRMEYTYDSNGNRSSSIDYYWNPTTGAQSSLNRAVFYYDPNYLATDVLNVPELYSNTTLGNKLIRTTSYASRTGGSVASVDYYYYSTVEINTAVHTASTDKVSFYPNPAKDFLQISGIDNIKTVLITDLNGKLIQNTNRLSANNKIYIGNLPKGMYIVKVISDKKAFQQKIVKQ